MGQRIDAEGPRSVRIDAVDQPMDVKAVRLVVGVEYMHEEPLAGLGVQDGARNPPIERRLVDVGGDQRRGVRNRKARVEILAIDDRVQPADRDLRVGIVPSSWPWLNMQSRRKRFFSASSDASGL
jgi:hypothetical protein